MIVLAVTYVIRPGSEEEAAGLFSLLTAESRREPGCRMYQVHRALDDPRSFFIYEQYDDEAALEHHRASPHFTRYGKEGLWPMTERRDPKLYAPLPE